MKNLLSKLKITIFILLILVAPSTSAAPLSGEELQALDDWTNWADENVCGGSGSISGNGNNDYSGREILNEAARNAIARNQPIYQKAAAEVDIPWQLLATTHYRETSLARVNPDNGQGIFQFVAQAGQFPSSGGSEVSEQEFERQAIMAAKFLKDKAASSNLPENSKLTSSSSAEVIKDTLFSYNGRAEVYRDQAIKLGFSPNQPYEGSPYVMNKADAKRDPTSNTTTWGQIKRDFGPIEYPANEAYGAFVIYSAMGGFTGSGGCAGAINCDSGGVVASSPLRQKVVCIARQELEAYKSKTMNPGNDFTKYTGGAQGHWCAWFSSWVYNQAGYPIVEGNEGRTPGVRTIREAGLAGQKFVFHAVGTYTPVPGDLVIYDAGEMNSHVNIVSSVEGNKMKLIGGNQDGTSSWTTSKVTEWDSDFSNTYGQLIGGYVSPKE